MKTLNVAKKMVADNPVMLVEIDDIKDEEVVKEVTDAFTNLTYEDDDGVGIQIRSDIFMDFPTRHMFDEAFQTVTSLHKYLVKEEVSKAYQSSWFFINKPDEGNSNFHHHTEFADKWTKSTTTYTWTYYLQLPDNCIDDEGKLGFQKFDDTSVVEYLEVFPKTLYIFSGAAWHRPMISPNSTKDRIVAAGNVCIANASKSFLFL